jgi:hypothetical protein
MRYTHRTEARRQAEQAVLQAIRATFATTRWHVRQLCETPSTAPAVRALCDTYEWSLVTPTHVGRALHEMVREGAPLKRSSRGGAIFWSLVETTPTAEIANTSTAATPSGRRPSARYANP